LTSKSLINDFENKKISKWTISNKGINNINISLVEDFKGMESNIIIYLHEATTEKNYDYVAYTRAKYYLYDFTLK
jgi:hypothetical protein